MAKPKLTVEEQKARLKQIAETLQAALKEPDRGYVWVSIADAEHLAAGLEAFFNLAGEAKRPVSLDSAFGISRGPGAPRKRPTEKQLAIARDAFPERKLTWDKLAEKHKIADERQVRAIAKRFEGDALLKCVEELVSRVDARVAKGDNN